MTSPLRFAIRPRGILTLLAALALCQPLLATDVYVAPDGNDSNAGTQQSPVATIQHARDLVRAQIAGGMTSDIIVHIGAGNYFIEQAVTFDDRDGGTNGHTVTYQGAPNLATRIYGGRRITNWTQVTSSQFTATVADLQSHYTLYENDVAANGGYYHEFADVTAGNWSKSGTTLTYYPRNLPIANQVVVLGTTKDVFIVMGRSTSQIVSNIVFDGLHMIGSDYTGSWPGGDSDFPGYTGLYDGVQLTNIPIGVIFPEARHGQFYLRNAQNIVVRNSKLYGAGFMAAFFDRWAQSNTVQNCWIENTGRDGLYFQGWEPGRGASDGLTTLAAVYCNKFNVVTNNVIYDVGRFGGSMGVRFDFSGDNRLEHNVIRGASGGAYHGHGWRPNMINILGYYVMHNMPSGYIPYPYDQTQITFYDDKYVVTQANQGAELNHCRNNLIQYNDVSQSPRSAGDTGTITQWGAGPNSTWAYNAVHDNVALGGWCYFCLYDDDGSHKPTLKNNVLYWINATATNTAGIVSKGNFQINTGNIFADCVLGQGGANIGPFCEEATRATWSNNIVAAEVGTPFTNGVGTQTPVQAVKSAYMIVGVTDTDANITSICGPNANTAYPLLQSASNNVYYYQPLDRADSAAAGAASLQSQVSANQSRDTNSVYADPLFNRQHPWWDARCTDYALQSGSPALARGYQQFDLTQIGLQTGFPFSLTNILGQPVNKIRAAGNFSRLLKLGTSGSQLVSAGGAFPAGSWVRYNSMDFGTGLYDQFQAHLQWAASASQGTGIELRLDAPDGTLIGTLPYGQTTSRISTTSGVHDLFLVFPGANVQSVDWFIIKPRIIWSGTGSDNKWSTAANWTSPVSAGETLYFGASSRTTPTNDFSAGTTFAGIGFDAGAPAYTLGGNAITLSGDLVNSSSNNQTVNLPITLPSSSTIRVDTGASDITLGGTLSGASSGFTKTGTGTLRLSGAANITGNIVTDGGTLTLTETGSLSFKLADASSNRLTGTGAVVLNGSFNIDRSAVTRASGGWRLVDLRTLGSATYGTTFNLPGWTKSNHVWTLVDGGGNTWTFTEATGVLMLGSGAGPAYYTWEQQPAGSYGWNAANWFIASGAPESDWPDAVDAFAQMNIDYTGAQTITLNKTITVGGITLGDSTSPYYGITIAAGTAGSLVMDVSTGSATITRTNTDVADTISAGVQLNDNLIVSDANGSDSDGGNFGLKLTGPITESGGNMSVTKTAGGAVTLSGTNNYSGGTTVGQGGFFRFNPASIGSGPLTINGNNSNPPDITSNGLQLNGNEVIINGGFRSHYGFQTGTGPVRLAAAGFQVQASVNIQGVVTALDGSNSLNALDIDLGGVGGWGANQRISSNIVMRGNQTMTHNSGWGTLDIWRGIVSGNISDGGNGYNLTKAGNSHTEFAGTNTYTGNTIVSAGKLTLGSTSSTKFKVTDSGSNKITGTAEVVLNGAFNIDTSAVTITAGAWTLVDVATLTETFGSSFNVVGFTKESSNVWKKTEGAKVWYFDTTTGILANPVGWITDFRWGSQVGTIDQVAQTISLVVPAGTNLTTLNPTYTLTSGTCNQTSGSPPSPTFAVQNPATYTVTDSGGTRSYVVTVTVIASPTLPPVTAGLVRFFDASQLAGYANGNPVSTWPDLSGNGANATVPSGNANPTYVANAGMKTGMPALYFAKNGGAGSSGALHFTRAGDIRTVFSVFKGNSFLLTDTNAFHFHRQGDDNPADPLWDGPSQHSWASTYIVNGSTYVNGTSVNGTSYAMPADLHGGFNLVEVITTGNVQADSFNKDRVYHAGNQYQAEVLIYNRVLSEQERLAVESYLTNKWFGATRLSYANWASTKYPGKNLSDPNADLDGDGRSNYTEYAFGLNPTTGSSCNPISVLLNKGTRQFTYTKTDNSGLTYTVWTSTDLQTWAQDAAATQTPGSAVDGVVPVTVTLSTTPLPGRIFVRVKAEEPQP